MTYAQWLEQTRRQAAERQAEAVAAVEEGEADESDLLEGGGDSDEQGGRASRFPTLAPEKTRKDGARAEIRNGSSESGETQTAGAKALVDHEALAARLKSCLDTALPMGNPVKSCADTERDTPATPLSRKEDPTWLPAVEYFQAGEAFEIGDISISSFTIPHDAADPVGFVFEAEGVRMGFATDLGYIPPNVKAQLRGLDLLLLESNHDLEMLKDGPYPWSVKQRVLSRVGHLSNEAAAGFLEDGYDGQAAYVILAHLSESNNLPELARVMAERALNGRASLMANRLLLAEQNEPLFPIDF
jgi:hypothetical protein